MSKLCAVGTGTSRLRAAGRIIGPWPIRPVLLTAFLMIFMILWAGARLSTEEIFIPSNSIESVLLAIVSALIMGTVLFTAKRIAPRFISGPVGYFVALGASAGVGAVFRIATGQLPAEAFPNFFAAFAFAFFRLLLFLIAVQAILGLATRRVEEQVVQTNEALESSRRLQRRLLEADERTRAQVAILLHDRVQAGLIAACLELSDSIDDPNSNPAPAIRDVVGRLEAMRDIDVRQAARILSPDLTSLDLLTALEDVAAQYLPTMRTDVSITQDVSVSLERIHLPALLAIYRITEQSLLNAAVHGRARNCRVEVGMAEGMLTLNVLDDGVGLAAITEPGLGSFINDTWVGILGGSWQVRTHPVGGTEVSARVATQGTEHANVEHALTGMIR